jgi:aryl-alcohol dehydrogenase-like predicted oxidoreductase
VNLFDSADGYSKGVAQEILGAVIKGRRNQVLISTNATFPTGDGPHDHGSSRYRLIEAVDKARERLGTDHRSWDWHQSAALSGSR